jgi:hypothetical protein
VDHITKTLTVKGIIYIDGNVTTTGSVNRYTGQATLYVSGTFTVNGTLCGGIAFDACDFASWNPNTTMLTVVADGNAGLERYSISFGNSAQFQGALYAISAIFLGTWAKSDGPMVGSTIVLSNHVANDPFAHHDRSARVCPATRTSTPSELAAAVRRLSSSPLEHCRTDVRGFAPTGLAP